MTLPTEQAIADAVAVLRRGGLIALPTETVYGLGADAENELAVRRIFAAKGRPATHPLIVHLAGRAAMPSWVKQVPLSAEALAHAFWPGPLTLVLHRSSRASDAITGGQDTVALRVPDHPVALAVLEAFGGGIAAPSANRFGHLSPTTAEHVRTELGGEVDLILDGGPCAVGVESTIVDLTCEQPRILRPGGISGDDVARVVGRPVSLADAEVDVRAPGMLASHYAPRAGLVLVPVGQLAAEAEARARTGARVAMLSPLSGSAPSTVTLVTVPSEPDALARVLYATLRRLDEEGFDLVVASLPVDQGLGQAVRDRLTRAAAPRPSAH